MRESRTFIILVLVLLLTGVMFGQSERGRRDGNWWLDQSQFTKACYMIGFFDGMELGKDMTTWQTTAKHPDVAIAAVKSYTDFKEQYFLNVSSQQIADGLDEFYKDYRNRSIVVHTAVWVVVKQIAGTPKDEIEKLVTNARKNAL